MYEQDMKSTMDYFEFSNYNQRNSVNLNIYSFLPLLRIIPKYFVIRHKCCHEYLPLPGDFLECWARLVLENAKAIKHEGVCVR